MGIFSIASQHIRFAVKLACAIVLALFVGFHFQLETPRWAVLTAAIVAAGPAFAAGGEPYSGAIRYRGMLRIIGTFIGCFAALTIIILMIRTPLLMLMVCCIWAGFCTWISSLVKVENSYAWGLAGYTALIIIITIQSEPLLAPQFAVERCSEIVIGIVSAIVADLLFSPRSIKQEVDRELDALIVAQYQLMQLCIKHGDSEEVDKAWSGLVRRTQALEGMRSNLNMESSRWAHANRRLKALNTVSLTLITQACETYLIQNTRPEAVTDTFRELFAEPVETVQDVHKQLKRMRRVIAWTRGARHAGDHLYLGRRRDALSAAEARSDRQHQNQRGGRRGAAGGSGDQGGIRRAPSRHGQLLAYDACLHARHAVLAVDGLDVRQRRDGNDCRCDRTGDASA
ncbi:p-hydroxybenzoic acid efflux subunit AaeB [Enterobacter asburiae]|uniref:p-hydroxybenzoic acid efflux subunit AaeB n=1 Tax=Enterobacter asburiae TaxID=61645 RepID=A0A376FFY5_ENTAS|nr:p-hydroxybenzoic acid efflux subunit AaeB [Enterobacter asburiae]